MERYHIILADDHILFRHGLRRLIEEETGLEVIGEAGDGLELLSLLNTMIPDMVILDIKMPNLRGIEAAIRVKTKCPDVKVLILSMYREYLHQAITAGVDGYILKEDADRELFSAIANIRQGKMYLCPQLIEDLTNDAAPSSELLSVREREVLKLIAEGKTNREIAEAFFLSVRTVESHHSSILSKLKTKSTVELIRYAMKKGYI